MNLKRLIKLSPKHLLVAGTAWISRLISLIINIYTIRILTTQLGSESYAVFVLLSGLMPWFALFDMGIGVSAQNFISENRSSGNNYKEYIMASAILALVLFLLFAIILLLFSTIFSSIYLIKFTLLSDNRKVLCIILSGLIFLGTSLGGIGYKIWFAEQKGYWANLMPAIAACCTLFFIWFLNCFESNHRLFLAIVIVYGPSALISIFTFVYIVKKNFVKINFEKKLYKSIISRGFKFFGLSLMAAFAMNSDYYFVSQFLSIEETIIYSILSKIFVTALSVYSALLTAFWPVCSELLFKNKWVEVKKYVFRYQLFGAMIILGAVALLLLYKEYIINFFVPSSDFNISNKSILIFGFYYLIRIWTDMFSTVFSSINKLTLFYAWVPMQILISLSLQMILSKYFGMDGLIGGIIISLLATTVWVLPYQFTKESRR